MEISATEIKSDISKIALSGRMDINGVATIEEALTEMTATPGKSFIVDMSEVPYMSSIGIRALLMNAKAVSRRGGKLIILSPQENVKMVLTTSGIDQIIRIESDLDTALGSLGE